MNSGCVTLDKSPNLSGLQHWHLKNGPTSCNRINADKSLSLRKLSTSRFSDSQQYLLERQRTLGPGAGHTVQPGFPFKKGYQAESRHHSQRKRSSHSSAKVSRALPAAPRIPMGAWHGGPTGSSSCPFQLPGAPATARFMSGGGVGTPGRKGGVGKLGSRTQDKKLGS